MLTQGYMRLPEDITLEKQKEGLPPDYAAIAG
jgi:hypothetical protein